MALLHFLKLGVFPFALFEHFGFLMTEVFLVAGDLIAAFRTLGTGGAGAKAEDGLEESNHGAKAEKNTCYEYGESCNFASVEICFACPKK